MPKLEVQEHTDSDKTNGKTMSSSPALSLAFLFCSDGPVETSSASKIRRNFEMLSNDEFVQTGTRGFPEEVTTIELNPEQMIACNVSCLEDVVRHIEDGHLLENIGETDVSYLADAPIQLKNIATVTSEYEYYQQVFCKDGRNGVTFLMIPKRAKNDTEILKKLTMNVTFLPGESLALQPPAQKRVAVGFVTNRFGQSLIENINHHLRLYDLFSYLVINSVDSTSQNAIETGANQQWFTVWSWLDVPTERLVVAQQNMAAMITAVSGAIPGLRPDRVIGVNAVTVAFDDIWENTETAPYTLLLNDMRKTGLFSASWLREPLFRNKLAATFNESLLASCTRDNVEPAMAFQAALNGIEGVWSTPANGDANYRIFLGSASKTPADIAAVSFRCTGDTWMRVGDAATIDSRLTVHPGSIFAPEVTAIFSPQQKEEVVRYIRQWGAALKIDETGVKINFAH
ncbi:MAG: hypothetical protein JXX14_09240 [Deltaproteobacteria bacterium]|nr:hypothetical protein [Deltaproteobacteria bacterium]